MRDPEPHIYEFGDFRLDAGRRLLLRRDGSPVPLKPKPFETLLYLVEHSGEILDKNELMQAVWPDTAVEENNLSQSVSALRRALGEKPDQHRYIVTVPGRGFGFVAAVSTRVAEEGEAGPPDQRVGPAEERAEAVGAGATRTGGPATEADKSTRRRTSRRAWLAALLVLALAAGGLLWRYLRPTSDRPPFAQRIVPLTSFPGRELQPAFSPDGHQLAFAWNGPGGDNYDIYVKQLGSETPLRLTNSLADDHSPAWSPDGQQIAFVRFSEKEISVLAVPALGGPERKLTSVTLLQSTVTGADKTARRSLSWSPDGKLLTFPGQSSPEGPHCIFLLSVETLEKHQLTTPPPTGSGDWEPTFSPDGNTLAFARGADIYLVPVSGGEPRRLTFEARAGSLAWTPDGSGLVFFALVGNTMSLWKVAAAGGTPEQVAAYVRGPNTPAFDRQGRLAYVQHNREVNMWRIEVPVARGAGSSPTRLIPTTLPKASPQFSPDGKKIVFRSESGGSEIWVCDSDGLNTVQLTTGIPGSDIPRWSPDGQQIAFQSSAEGNNDVYVISTEGGRPRRITTEASDDGWPSWSRDGRWVYFGSDRGGDWQVWKAPAGGGPAVQVTRHGGREAFESPDGRFVYYVKSHGLFGVWGIPAEGGEEVLVLDRGSQGFWGVAETGIYFAEPDVRPNPTVHFYSFATHQLVHVATLEKRLLQTNVGAFAVSPDGRWILCVQLDRAESDIMLVENFR